MNPDKIIAQRFADLEKKADEVRESQIEDTFIYVDTQKFHQWATSVLSLLLRVVGEKSPHYMNFDDQYKRFNGLLSAFTKCRGVFQAAKEDYEFGALFSVRGLIKAEDTSDMLDQASDLLKGRQKDLACMLAGVSLEIAIKELCQREGLSFPRLETMNEGLCKKGVYNSGMQKQVTAWAHWRNKAAHGDWSEYKEADVDEMIKGVTRFVAEYL